MGNWMLKCKYNSCITMNTNKYGNYKSIFSSSERLKDNVILIYHSVFMYIYNIN